MNRIGVGLLAIAFAMTLGVTAAAAQYPEANRPDGAAAGAFTPGGQGSLTVNGAAPGSEEPATINSAPIPVNDTADANGVLVYTFTVPADFELNALHSITFTKGGSLSFCVNGSGAVAACSSIAAGPGGTGGSSIPRTGADYVDDGLRAAAVAITGGALLLLWRRRAAASASPAS